MSGPFNGFTVDHREDDITEQRENSCHRDTMDPMVSVSVPTYQSKEPDITNHEQRSIGAISKEMIRTFQTTVQGNPHSELMVPGNEASSAIQPRLHKFSSEGSRIAQSVQQLAIFDGVSDKLSMVNDKLGSMMRMSCCTFQNHTSSGLRDRGIYSSQNVRAWGSTVSSEISCFASQKVVPLFRRQNTYPSSGNAHLSTGGLKGSTEVSFDYQLMKDNE